MTNFKVQFQNTPENHKALSQDRRLQYRELNTGSSDYETAAGIDRTSASSNSQDI